MSQEQTPPDPIELLDEKACAARLKVRRETLSRWRRDQHMPYIALGGGKRPRIRYVWEDVAEWLRGQGQNVPEAPAPKRGRGRPRNVDRAGGR